MATKRRSLKEIAGQRGMSEKDVVKQALENGGNINAAATLLGISRSSVSNAMRNYGLELLHKTVVKEASR